MGARLRADDHHAFHEDAKPGDLSTSITHPLAKLLEPVGDHDESLGLRGHTVGGRGHAYPLRDDYPVPVGMEIRGRSKVHSPEEGVPGQDHRGRLSLEAGGHEGVYAAAADPRYGPVVDFVPVR